MLNFFSLVLCTIIIPALCCFMCRIDNGKLWIWDIMGFTIQELIIIYFKKLE